MLQYDIRWEDPEQNFALIDQLVGTSPVEFDLLVLPEMFNTGFSMHADGLAEEVDGQTIQWLKNRAGKWKVDVICSLIIREKQQFFNRCVRVGSQGIKQFYDKRHLFGLGGEDKVFSAGSNQVIMEWNDWKIMPFICYDLRFPVWTRSAGVADVQIYIANFPAKRREAWITLLKARAIENQCFVIGVNRIGIDGADLSYSGDSMAIDPLGTPLLNLQDHQELGIIALNGQELQKLRESLPFYKDADPFQINISTQ